MTQRAFSVWMRGVTPLLLSFLVFAVFSLFGVCTPDYVCAEGYFSIEECAAHLLSPAEATRAHGAQMLAKADPDDTKRVLAMIAERGHDVDSWLAALAEEASQAQGAVLERIERMRDALIGPGTGALGIDIHSVTLSRERARTILGDLEGMRSGVDRTAWEAIWKEVAAETDPVKSPWLAIPGRDRCPMEAKLLRRVSYVGDFDVLSDGHVADPILRTLTVGTVARWTPRIAADQESIRLDMDLSVSILESPIATRDVVVGEATVQAQSPVVHVARRRRSLVIPAGGYALFAVPAGEDATLIILRAALGAPRNEPPPRTSPSSD